MCATTADNSGVYVYYLKGIVSVCFRCPARTVGFSGTRLYLCIYNQPSWATLKRYPPPGQVGAREDYSLVVACTRRRSICYPYSRHPLQAQAPLNLKTKEWTKVVMTCIMAMKYVTCIDSGFMYRGVFGECTPLPVVLCIQEYSESAHRCQSESGLNWDTGSGWLAKFNGSSLSKVHLC